MLPIDPTAESCRKAWVPCPNCAHGTGCGDCHAKRNCADHWQYLLSNCGPQVYLQCPGCAHLWAFDTRNRTCSQVGVA